MLESQKGWQSLDSRRPDQRLVLFYKIINGLASVETGDILTAADSRSKHATLNDDKLYRNTKIK